MSRQSGSLVVFKSSWIVHWFDCLTALVVPCLPTTHPATLTGPPPESACLNGRVKPRRGSGSDHGQQPKTTDKIRTVT